MSRRGKIGVPFETTVTFSGNPESSIFSRSNVTGKPSCSIIAFEVVIMNGWMRWATTRRLAAKCAITDANCSLSPSSLASTHGAVSSIYLLVREMIFQTASKARGKSTAFICLWNSSIFSATTLAKSASKSVTFST